MSKRPLPRPKIPPPALLDRQQFNGHVDRFTFQSEDGTFAIARFVLGDETFTIKGNLFGIKKGEPIRVTGEWKEDPQYGMQLVLRSVLPIEPQGVESLAIYLGSGVLKGVGPVVAQRIVEKFGEDTIKVLDEAPERLEEISGLSRAKAQKAAASWADKREQHEAAVFLTATGLTKAMTNRLIKFYGADAARVLRANPYQVALEVPLIGFVRADAIASKMGIARDSPERVRAGIVHCLSRAQDDGHTFLEKAALLVKGAEMLGQSEDLVEAQLAVLRNEGSVHIVAIPDGREAVYTKAMWRSETGVARELRRIARHARPLLERDLDGHLDAFEQQFNFSLAQNQRAAIRAAAGGGVVVVTGGPGTGKTTLVRTLLHVLRDVPGNLALSSPTGRAAQRLSETTHHQATTIHRLLKFNAVTGKFTHSRQVPLELNLLIVDESSMMDIPLCYHLLRAVPDGCTLVFVGDADQLPSVGPGSFFRDLIQSGFARTVRLDTIFRQAMKSLIIRNSHRINSGEVPLSPPPEEKDADFYIVRRDEPEAVRDAIIEMVTTRIPQRFGFDPVADVQVLTPMRKGVLGTDELNRILQEKLNPHGAPTRGFAFRVGDKVLQTVNNYDLDVFNGDTGILEGSDAESGTCRIRFGRRVIFYPYDQMDQLQLAYAMTIHKAQGSEYQAVVMPVHTTHFVMLRRNLLYTGVTRGKKLVVLVGSYRALGIAVKGTNDTERNSLLAHWIVTPPDGEVELEL